MASREELEEIVRWLAEWDHFHKVPYCRACGENKGSCEWDCVGEKARRALGKKESDDE